MHDGERALSTRRVIGRSIGALIIASAVVTSIYAYRLNFVNPCTDDAAVRANVCRDRTARQRSHSRARRGG